MNIEKFLKKELLYSKAFILIGVIAGIVAFGFEYQKELMVGLTIGFISAGLGTLLVYNYAKDKPNLKKNIELQNEERNTYINTKAGYTAFWISYWYIFLSVILSYTIRVSVQQFLTITLFFMPIVYFLSMFIYHRKY